MPPTRVTTQEIRDNSIVNTDVASNAAIDASKIANGTVSNTEYQYLDGTTSNIQSQINSTLLTAPAVDLRNLITPVGEFTALTIHDNWSSGSTPYNVFAVKNTGGSNSLLSVTNVAGAYSVRVHVATPLRFYDSDSSNFAAIKAASAISVDYTLTLPTTAPVANGYLTTDGSGNLSWIVGVPASRTISTTSPLAGGGDLTTNRTLTTSMSTNRLIGRTTAGTGVMEQISVGAGLQLNAGSLSLNTPIGITDGGTGQTSANAALNALLPTQTGLPNHVLTTNGSSVVWQSISIFNAIGGGNGSILFNALGAFGGNSYLLYDDVNSTVRLNDGNTPAATMTISASLISLPLVRLIQTTYPSEAFVVFEGTSSANTTNNISTATGWLEQEMIRVTVNGATRWIRTYSKT